MSSLSDALAAMDKATPGPWKAYIGKEIHGILDAAGKRLAELWVRKSYDNKANAKVIAAAPDAMAIIKRMLPYIENARDEVKSVVEMGFSPSKALDAQLADLNDIIGQIKGDDALIARAKPEEVGR